MEDAAEALGGRVTVGDVAARAGVSLGDAERTLNALAADAQGVLEVSGHASCHRFFFLFEAHPLHAGMCLTCPACIVRSSANLCVKPSSCQGN